MKKLWIFLSLLVCSILVAGCAEKGGTNFYQNSEKSQTNIEDEIQNYQWILSIERDEEDRIIFFRWDFGTHTDYLTISSDLKRWVHQNITNELFVWNIVNFSWTVKKIKTSWNTNYYEIVSVENIENIKNVQDMTKEQYEELDKRERVFVDYLVRRITEPETIYYFLDSMDMSWTRELIGLTTDPIYYNTDDCKVDKIWNYIVKWTIVSYTGQFWCIGWCDNEEEYYRTAPVEEYWAISSYSKDKKCYLRLPLWKASWDNLIWWTWTSRAYTWTIRIDSIPHFKWMDWKNLRSIVDDWKEHTFRVFSFITEAFEWYRAEDSAILDRDILE